MPREGEDLALAEPETWDLKQLQRDEPPPPPTQPKERPNYATTGALAQEANTVNGVALSWSEPADSKKPDRRWRLYVFKSKEQLDPLHIHRQHAYLLGRERRVCDIPLDHPSCSSQHAVLQYRETKKVDGTTGEKTRAIRPYLMDLESTNGSYINGERVEPRRYIELLHTDAIRFGYSSREYVLIDSDRGVESKRAKQEQQ